MGHGNRTRLQRRRIQHVMQSALEDAEAAGRQDQRSRICVGVLPANLPSLTVVRWVRAPRSKQAGWAGLAKRRAAGAPVVRVSGDKGVPPSLADDMQPSPAPPTTRLDERGRPSAPGIDKRKREAKKKGSVRYLESLSLAWFFPRPACACTVHARARGFWHGPATVRTTPAPHCKHTQTQGKGELLLLRCTALCCKHGSKLCLSVLGQNIRSFHVQ